MYVLADFRCQFDWAGDISLTVKALLMGLHVRVFLELVSTRADRLHEENHTIMAGYAILLPGNPQDPYHRHYAFLENK